MKQILYVDEKLPGLNEMTNASRSNKYASASQKKRYTNLVAWKCKEDRLRPFKSKIDVTFTWNCKNKRRDKDNIIAGQKYVFDGLQVAGIIVNDGWNEIGNINHKFRISNEDSVEVIMQEVQE